MNPYEVLSVRKNASQAEIKKAYYRLSEKYNPNNYQGDLNYAQNRLLAVSEAFLMLSDPEKRKAYDQKHDIHVNLHNSSPMTSKDTYKDYYKRPTSSAHTHNDYSVAKEKYDNFQRQSMFLGNSLRDPSRFEEAIREFATTGKISSEIETDEEDGGGIQNVPSDSRINLVLFIVIVLIIYALIQLSIMFN